MDSCLIKNLYFIKPDDECITCCSILTNCYMKDNFYRYFNLILIIVILTFSYYDYYVITK